ncbi:biotin/lipoate A/B protein ligase family protein [Pseudoscardovia radai]|uniref:lipoate--protein ligase family protein n=1 Tax=Pseudoscardovia radai TaxID=987066 RepID=UPI003991FD78
MRQTRGEYKTPGGKLVGVTIMWSDHTHAGETQHAEGAQVDGDFFASVDELTIPLLKAAGMTIAQCVGEGRATVDDIDAALHRLFSVHAPDALPVGIDARAIAIAAARAVGETDAKGAATSQHVAAPQHAVTPQHGGIVDDAPVALSEAWNRCDWGVMRDPEPFDPAMQMAFDEAIARSVACGRTAPLLRLWEWGAPAVVIGAFQSLSHEADPDAARSLGFTVVRRCTGGGAMFVRPEHTVTFSLYVPLAFVDGLTPREAYRRCNEWVVVALRQLGLDVRFDAFNDLASPRGKIGGSAARRFPAPRGEAGAGAADAGAGAAAAADAVPGCLLHHVTMAYDIDADTMVRVLRVSSEKMRDKAVKSASRRVDPLRRQLDGLADSKAPRTRGAIVDYLGRFALATLPGAHEATIGEDVMADARALRDAKYATQWWTSRIA